MQGAMAMNLKPFTPGFTPPHLICLACSAVFLLGACSGSNPAGTSSGGDAVETPGAAARDAVTLADAASLARANDQYAAAQAAVNAATAAVAAAGSEADRAEARRLIAAARTAIEAAVTAAEAALTAAADGSAADIGNAARARDRANALRTSQTRVLDNALASFAWYTNALARFQIPNGEAAMPPSGGDGVTVEIDRIPRTIPDPDNPGSQKANPQAICGTNSEGTNSCPDDIPDTFKDVPYEEDKLLFSVADDAENGDEFKVGGYVGTDAGLFDPQPYTLAGLKLTSDGIVIRTGGSPPTSVSNPQWDFSDFTDTRRNITAYGNAGAAPHGDNAWDLVLKFGAPQTMSIPGGPPSRNLQSDWTGDGNFYWRSYVPAADSQLETDGEHYAANAFNQPEGYKDLGTYEVWLSNYLGANLEPVPGSGVVRCLDGTTGTSCPYDYTHYYLKYAAYGLFSYSADRQTYTSFANGQVGRIHAMHFGYSAFASEDGKRTKDIGTAITRASFRGHTLAYAVTGSNQTVAPAGNRDSKLLRGDAVLTVSIPSAGSGRLAGNLANFEEWTGSRWRPLTSGFGVTLEPADISSDGTFSGAAMPTGDTIRNRGSSAPEDFPSRIPPGNIAFAASGGIVDTYLSNRFIGVFNGSFYGPRDDSADLEVAGSWQLVGSRYQQWEVYGSFGAKQRPAASSN